MQAVGTVGVSRATAAKNLRAGGTPKTIGVPIYSFRRLPALRFALEIGRVAGGRLLPGILPIRKSPGDDQFTNTESGLFEVRRINWQDLPSRDFLSQDSD